MRQKARRWLNDLPLSDPLEHQQAGLLQVMLLVIFGACVIGLLISLISSNGLSGSRVGLIDYTILIVCTIGGLTLLRQGRFLVASFHPELTGDTRVHETFLELVREESGVRA